MIISTLIPIGFILIFLGCLYKCALYYKHNIWLKRKNDLLNKRLRSATRKAETWRRGWDAEKQRFLEALGDAFLLVNAQGQILAANERAKHLLQDSGLEGRLLNESSAPPELKTPLVEALVQDKSYTTQISYKDTLWALEVAPVIGIIGCKRLVLRDVTEQHRTEQVRKDFVANASHELRTPLTIIMGYIESLQEDQFIEDSPQLAKKFLHTMEKHGLRLRRIVEDMLLISKLESGEASQLKITNFSLNDCIADVFSRLESIAERQKACLAIDFLPLNISLTGDLFYWTQIFFNLIENALKQNPHTPNLIITVGARIAPLDPNAIQDTSQHLHLWVDDNGVGIPSNHLPYIFKRFYRAETPQTEEIKGTGLGLSIVKRAVEAHQGTISAESTPGDHTTFHIFLPLTPPPTVAL